MTFLLLDTSATPRDTLLVNTQDFLVDLGEVLITAELAQRPQRPPDYEAEARAVCVGLDAQLQAEPRLARLGQSGRRKRQGQFSWNQHFRPRRNPRALSMGCSGRPVGRTPRRSYAI